MFDLKPVNKYIVIEPMESDGKVGSLFVVDRSNNSYKLAKIIALSDCDECKGLQVGQVVLYDTIGSVAHRLPNDQHFTTVKAANVVTVLEGRS